MKIDLKWVGGATWILNAGPVKIACDPVLCPMGSIQDYIYFKTERQNDPIFDNKDFHDVDIWLITHNHEDHIDSYGMEVIKEDSIIIHQKGLNKAFPPEKYTRAAALKNHKMMEFSIKGSTVKITAVPAVHAARRIFSSLIGNGSGYIIEISDGSSTYKVYATGDSVFNEKRDRFLKNQNLDLVIANAGSAMIGHTILADIIGRVTNNSDDIEKMALSLNPALVIPVHWGTFSHYIDKIDEEKLGKHGNIRIIPQGEKTALML